MKAIKILIKVMDWFNIIPPLANKESTINIVKDYGLVLHMQYENGSPPLTPTITDQLLCYSNGYTQIFDCEVNYISYKETPIT